MLIYNWVTISNPASGITVDSAGEGVGFVAQETEDGHDLGGYLAGLAVNDDWLVRGQGGELGAHGVVEGDIEGSFDVAGLIGSGVADGENGVGAVICLHGL